MGQFRVLCSFICAHFFKGVKPSCLSAEDLSDPLPKNYYASNFILCVETSYCVLEWGRGSL